MASGLENVREHTCKQSMKLQAKTNAWFVARVFHRIRSCEIWEGKDSGATDGVQPSAGYVCVCVDV